MNLDWLFQNLLEIEIDFGVGSKSIFDKHFKVKYSEENSGICYGKKFRNIVEDYKNSFELLLLASNIISKYSNLYIFSINNYSCYFFELDYLTSKYYPELQVIHILDLFNNFVNLIKINVNFNALDSFTFERIINLIHINNTLKCINFDFKLNGEDFSLQSLKRIYLKHYLFCNSPNEEDELKKNEDYYKANNSPLDNGYSYLQSIYNTINYLRKKSTDSEDVINTIDNGCSDYSKKKQVLK